MTYYLNDQELDGPAFLRALSKALLEVPGGWGGVSEDLLKLADNFRPLDAVQVGEPIKKGWEEIHADKDSTLCRIKVRAGYVYRSTMGSFHNGSLKQSITFVPDSPIKVKT